MTLGNRGKAPVFMPCTCGLTISSCTCKSQRVTPPQTTKAPVAGEMTLAGAIAYELTKKLVIDIGTARAAVDAAIQKVRDSGGKY